MISLNDFLLAGVLPGVAALVVRAAIVRVTGSDRAAWPLAVAIGYAAGQAGLMAGDGAAAAILAPREASHWLPLAGLLAAGVALAAGCCRAGSVLAIAAGTLLAVALPTRLLWGSVYLLSEWPRGEAAVRIGGLAAGLFAAGWLLTKSKMRPTNEPPADRHEANGAPAPPAAINNTTLSDTLIAPLLVAAAFGLAVVLATSGSLSYARLAGVLAAALAGATLGGVGAIKFSEIGAGLPAAGPVVAALAGGLILVGLLYAEVSSMNAALLAAAFAAAGAKRGWAPACPWRASALRVAACVVPLAIAVAGAASDFAEATSQAEENPYLNWSPPGE